MMSNEIWKDIEGYCGKYRISNMGRVMSMWRGNQYKEKNGKPHILKPSIHKQGYLKVNLFIDGKRKICFIHRLVALHFLDNHENLPEVNHKDENKTNNMVWVNEDGSIDYEKSNLEWCTGKYNSNYGTRIERHKEKISKPIIQTTLEGVFVKKYSSATEAAKETGYNASYIRMVCNGTRQQAYGYKWENEIHNKEQGYKPIAEVIKDLENLLNDNK